MSLKSLTYTSLASFDLSADDLEDIHRTAREVNGLEGITGLLVFNGRHFLQIVEGPPQAIHDLVERLRRDPRHSGVEIRHTAEIESRNFPSWSMELVRVSASYFEAKETLADRTPPTLDSKIREHLFNVTEAISGTVAF